MTAQMSNNGEEMIPAAGRSRRAAPNSTTRREELLASVDERRQRVWALSHVRQLTIREIGSVMGVAHRTVCRDLAAVRKRVHEHLRRTGKLEEAVLDAAAGIIETTNAVARQAWADLMDAPKGASSRGRFLRIVLSAKVEQIKLLQSLGVVKRVPEEVIIGGMELERQLQQLTDDQAEEALRYFGGLIAGDLSEAGGDGAGEERPALVDRSEPVDSG
jgi:predicted DNA-binding protein (UPF0251 family)